MPFSTTYANAILSLAVAQSTGIGGHNEVFLGLCANDPEASGGSFSELSGNGYHRVLINKYGSNYPDLMNSVSDRSVSNKKQIGFTKATDGPWPEVNGYGLFTSEKNGDPFFYAKLKNPVTTPEGAVFLFDPGELKIAFQTTDVEIE